MKLPAKCSFLPAEKTAGGHCASISCYSEKFKDALGDKTALHFEQKKTGRKGKSLLPAFCSGDVCSNDCFNDGALRRRLRLIGDILDKGAAQGDELGTLQCVNVAADGDGLSGQ